MKLSILMAIANSSPVSPIMHWMIFPSKWRTRNLFSISANANDFMFSCIIMAFHVIVDFVWWCTVDMLRLVNFLAAPEALKRGLHQLEFMAHTCHGTYLSFLCANVGNCQTSSTCFLLGLEVLFLDLHLASAIFPYTLEHGPPSNHLNVRKLLEFHYCQHLFLWTPAYFDSQNTIFTWDINVVCG